MNKTLLCLLLVSISACARVLVDMEAPSLQQPKGVAGSVWIECIRQIRAQIWNEVEDGDLTETELECLVTLAMEKCIHPEASSQAKEGINVFPDAAEMYQELARRKAKFCGSGGPSDAVDAIFEKLEFDDLNEYGPGQLVCPVPGPAPLQ